MSKYVVLAALVAAGPAFAQPPEKAAELTRDLTNPDAAVRAKSAWALAGREAVGDDAVKALRAALADDSRAVRGRAAVALHRAAKPPVRDVLPGLLAARGDADEAVRTAADEIWAEIGPGVRAAMPFVKRSLAAGTDPQAAQKAIDAISRAGLEAIPAILDALDEDRTAATATATATSSGRFRPAGGGGAAGQFQFVGTQSLSRIDRDAVPALNEALRDANPAVREVAAAALGRIGAAARPAVPALIALFKDRDPVVRQRAAEAVGQLGPTVPETVPALAEALSHKDPVVRRAAVAALLQLKPLPPVVAGALAKALDDPEPFVRVKAAEALCDAPAAKSGFTPPPAPPAAVLVLVEELRGRDAGGQQVARFLEGMGSRAAAARPVLLEMVAGRDRTARVAACRVLFTIGQDPARVATVLRVLLASDDSFVRVKAAEALWDQDEIKDALPVLLAVLGTNDPTAERVANAVISRVNVFGANAKDLVPHLADALAAENPTARATVLNLLQRIGQNARHAAPAVVKLLAAEDDRVRQSALTTLRSIGGATKEAVPELVAALKSSSPAARSQVAAMIRDLGPDAKAAVPALKEFLKDAAPASQLEALRVLHRVSPDDLADAVPVLVELARAKEPYVRQQAFQLLAQLGGSTSKAALPVIVEGLKSSDATLRSMASSALSRLEGGPQPEVQAALREILKAGDAEARLQVVSLVEKGSPDDRKALFPAMSELLKNEKVAIRLRAADVLRRQGDEGLTLAAPVLREAIKDPDPTTQLHAAGSLLQGSTHGGFIPHPSTTPTDDQKAAMSVISTALKTGSLRSTALSSLLSAPPPLLAIAADGLREAAADPEPMTRLRAAQFLTSLDGADREAGIKALADFATTDARRASAYRQQATTALIALGADGQKVLVPALLEALKDRGRRPQAFSELGQLGRAAGRDAIPVLKEILAEADPTYRLQAAEYLIRLGGEAETKAATAAVTGLLDNGLPGYRQTAANALSRLGPEGAKAARPVFRELLSVPQHDTQLAAAKYLTAAGTEDKEEVVAVLRRLLNEPQEPPYRRTQAALCLVEADPSRAAEATRVLLELLKWPMARGMVVDALAQLGAGHSPAVGDAVRAMLRDADPTARQTAVDLVGRLHLTDKEFLPSVFALSQDKQSGGAAFALRQFGADAVPYLLKEMASANPLVRNPAVTVVGGMGTDAAAAVPRLISLMTHDDRATRTAAVASLRQIGPAATAEVVKELTHADAARRATAADSLRGMAGGAKLVLAELEKAVGDPDAGVRRAAARSAFQRGSRTPTVVASLVAAVTSGDPPQRRDTATIIADVWPLSDEVLAALKPALAGSDPATRARVAGALARHEATAAAAAPVLVSELGTPSARFSAVNALATPGVRPEVLKAAVPALKELAKGAHAPTDGYLLARAGVALHRAGSPEGVAWIVTAATRARPAYSAPAYVHALLECGPEGAAAVRKLLAHEDERIQTAAIDAAAATARTDPETVGDLAAMLKHPDPATRVRVLKSLGAAGPSAKSAAAAVAAQLKDALPYNRTEAAAALAQIGAGDRRAEVLGVLRSALAGRTPNAMSVRVFAAVGVLGAEASAAVPDLQRHTNRSSDGYRAFAAEALGRIGKPAAAAVPQLSDLLRADDLTRTHAAVALWRITGEAGPSLPALTAALSSPGLRPTPVTHQQVFYQLPAAAMGGVTEFWGAPSMLAVAPYKRPDWHEPPVLTAARTLGEMGTAAKSADDALRQLEKDPDPRAREVATAALKRIEGR